MLTITMHRNWNVKIFCIHLSKIFIRTPDTWHGTLKCCDKADECYLRWAKILPSDGERLRVLDLWSDDDLHRISLIPSHSQHNELDICLNGFRSFVWVECLGLSLSRVLTWSIVCWRWMTQLRPITAIWYNINIAGDTRPSTTRQGLYLPFTESSQ